jgi:hypothetical protein
MVMIMIAAESQLAGTFVATALVVMVSVDAVALFGMIGAFLATLMPHGCQLPLSMLCMELILQSRVSLPSLPFASRLLGTLPACLPRRHPHGCPLHPLPFPPFPLPLPPLPFPVPCCPPSL